MGGPYHGKYRNSSYDTKISEIWCSYAQKEKARRIGNGHISEGVRKAIEAYKEPDNILHHRVPDNVRVTMVLSEDMVKAIKEMGDGNLAVGVEKLARRH